MKFHTKCIFIYLPNIGANKHVFNKCVINIEFNEIETVFKILTLTFTSTTSTNIPNNGTHYCPHTHTPPPPPPHPPTLLEEFSEPKTYFIENKSSEISKQKENSWKQLQT